MLKRNKLTIIVLILILSSLILIGAICKPIIEFPVKTQRDLDALKSQVREDLTYDTVVGNEGAYVDEIIKWGGQVYLEPEKVTKIEKPKELGKYTTTYYLTIWRGGDEYFIVDYRSTSLNVKKDDYVIVTGKVQRELILQKIMQRYIAGPIILAGIIEKTTKEEAGKR